MHPSYSLMIHGGAGDLDRLADPQQAAPYLDSMRRVLEQGRQLLAAGGSALDAVEHCAALLEDDPLFNAGIGAVLDEDGRVELDAGIMCGASLRAGGVAGIDTVANPVRLARALLERGEPVLLSGAGARRFAACCGFESVPDGYFLTPQRLAQWQAARCAQQPGPDHDPPRPAPDGRGDRYGTIGAVARDTRGNLAAATSTGGMVNKRCGRVGDSPVIGAGVYADNASCAASCTGVGEHFLRTALAKTLADLIDFKGLDAAAAAQQGIEYLARKVAGRGGFILIDHAGRCASARNTPQLIHGWIEHGGATCCRL